MEASMSHFTGPNPHGFALAGAFVGAAASLAVVDLIRASAFSAARSRIQRGIRHIDAMAAHRDAAYADAARLNAEADDILASLLD
jgi:outer membrane murein-binding lipoprotein Lpp